VGFPASDGLYLQREENSFIPIEERIPGFSEVEKGLDESSVRKESIRCLQYGCINCEKCVTIYPYDAHTLDFPVMKVDEEKCRSCGLCVFVCPVGVLTADIVNKE